VRRFWSAYLDDYDEADFGALKELEARMADLENQKSAWKKPNSTN
jgi:hypothetical protein